MVLRFSKFVLSSPNDMYNEWSNFGVKGCFFLGVWEQITLMPSKTYLTLSLLQVSLRPTILFKYSIAKTLSKLFAPRIPIFKIPPVPLAIMIV